MTPTPTTNGHTAKLPPEQQRAVKLLAGVWRLGLRHHASGDLAGGLLRRGWTAEGVERLIEAVAETADDDELPDRLEAVQSTAEKLRGGKAVTGFPSLASRFGADGERIVRELCDALGLDRKVTLAELAEEKNLPVEFLHELGIKDSPEGGVDIPYHDAGGKVAATRRRVAIKAGDGSFWTKGTSILAYGEDRLSAGTADGYHLLIEGETDCWACWFHGIAALGFPGADTVAKTLTLGIVNHVRKLYVWQEPDAGGETFVRNVRTRLAHLGWEGRLYVVRIDGIKDPADLHKANPDGFSDALLEALKRAEPLELAAGAAPPLPPRPPWPEALPAESLIGLAGDVVRVLDPASEADPAALLIQALIGFGSMVGRAAHFTVEADTHYANEFVVLVGRTAKGRKGTSWGQVRRLLAAAEEQWADERVKGGLSSGEGLVWNVRDPVMKQERIKERGEPVRYEEVQSDPGVCDKRLLLVEPEFASVLKQTERQGNTLSAALRQAWDGGTLGGLTKHDPTRATGAHISVIGHVTAEELRRYLSTTEMANGFGNRFLWVCVRRSKLLPEGGRVESAALEDLQRRLGAALATARTRGEMRRDEEARALWREIYECLSEGRPGLTGALLGRAEAHVMRLAMLYALLDEAEEIGARHLLAAVGLWEYVEQSVRHIFGDSLGDPVADELLRLLRAAPEGMTRTEMYNHFGRHQTSGRIGSALALLAEHGLAGCASAPTGGQTGTALVRRRGGYCASCAFCAGPCHGNGRPVTAEGGFLRFLRLLRRCGGNCPSVLQELSALFTLLARARGGS